MTRGARAAVLLAAAIWLALPSAAPAQDAGAGLRALDDCDARVRTAPRDPLSYYCYLQAVRGGAPAADAVRRLDALLAIVPDRHRARMILGMIENGQGNPRAEALLHDALEGMERQGDHHGVVYGGLTLAHRFALEGRFEEAEAVIARTERAADAVEDAELWASVRTEQAIVAREKADYGRSLRLYREAESAVFPDGPAWLQGNILTGLAWQHWYFGDLRQAMSAYRREAEIRQAAGDRFGEASPRFNRAFLAMELFDRGEISRDACRPLIEDALETAIAAGNVSVEAHARLLRARVLDSEEAIAELRRAIRLAERTAEASLRWSAEGVLAWRLLDLGGQYHDEALSIVERAAEQAGRAGMPSHLGYALQQRARVVSRVRPRDEAIAAWEECIDTVERIGKLQAEDTTRAYTLSHWYYPYDRLVELLLGGLARSADPGADLKRAFRTMERRHARSLVEILGDGAAAKTVSSPSLDDVRGALDQDEALLIWEVAPGNYGRSWLLAVARDGVEVRELPALEELAHRIAVFEGLLRAGDPLAHRVAADLHATVFDDVLDGRWPSLRSLFLIPDGPLHELPFAALRAGDGEPPIGTRLRLETVPSARLWIGWRSTEAHAGHAGALSLADPLLADDAAEDVLRGAGTLPGVLPLAREEARTVARMVPGEARLLDGAAATELALKTIDPATYRVLHLATHALADSARPERSAVLLAPGGEGEDGLLRIDEIAALDLQGHVVILSACRGAAGPVVGGEGVLGLARAFLAAGARAVLANRWPYRDDDAAALTRAMAREIERGASVGEALTAARRARQEAGAPATAWAGLTLFGDGGVTPAPGGRGIESRALLGLIPAGAVLLAWFAWFVARRR